MQQVIAGFDWDAGNVEKCRKHGVSIDEIETMFTQPLTVLRDERHSDTETRLNAVGKGKSDRSIFLVFTLRIRDGKTFIRPISARYMHRKEVKYYEKEISGLQDG